MAGKTNLYETHIESIVKWLSCNGEAWGMGPTVVFASAAALFLYNELQATVFLPGDHPRVSVMEKTLISTMVVGMLALMIHLWVCSMRFFQYYLDTLIRDSPSMLLEMTTAGLLGKSEVLPLGPLTRFLKQQQPQIHITVCWFLSLCYADYVRKHYCRRFNLPYLEQWQTELHERASNGIHTTMQKVNSFVGSIHRRLRNYTSPPSDVQTEIAPPKHSSVEIRGATSVSWAPLASQSQSLCTPLSVSLSTPSVFARVLHQSSETTAHAVAQLRRYITETRCSCNGAPNARKCASGPFVPKERVL